MTVIVIKRLREQKTNTFNDYKNCLINIEIVLKSQQRFKSEAHNVLVKKLTRLH